jgi:hypothetical protein
MGVPASGQLSLGDLRIYLGMQPTNISLRECTLVTAVGGYYDPQWFGTPYEISSFYNWVGNGYNYNFASGILHDFGLNAKYPTSTSVIADCAFTTRTGTFVTGTGNGTATNITGYSSTFPANIAINASSQYSIKLDNYAKFTGNSPYTAVIWFKVNSFPSNYPGLIAAEGRSGSTPIGWGLYISNAGSPYTYNITHSRWNGTSGSGAFNTISWSNGLPAFSTNKWYMAAARYTGSVNWVELFIDGTRYYQSIGDTNSVTSDASWGAFAGLRYNNWLDGVLGYISIYNSDIGSTGTSAIYEATRIRYGV